MINIHKNLQTLKKYGKVILKMSMGSNTGNFFVHEVMSLLASNSITCFKKAENTFNYPQNVVSEPSGRQSQSCPGTRNYQAERSRRGGWAHQEIRKKE